MTKDSSVRVRHTEEEKARWDMLAQERGMTLSDLIRVSIDAFTSGEAGVPFLPRCLLAPKHVAGITCPSCGGSRRGA